MKEGYYWLNLSTINNSPFNGTGYVHVKTINGTPIQKAVGVSSGDIANRVKYDSGWTPWAQVALKSDFEWKLFFDGNIESNTSDNIAISLPSSTVHEYLFTFGRDNDGQAYGGHNIVALASDNHPMIFPVYSDRYNDLSRAYFGMLYILATRSKIYVHSLSDKSIPLRMRIYYR